MDIRNKIFNGNAIDVVKQFPDQSVNCIVTSPPYWGMRIYKTRPVVWDVLTKTCIHKFDTSNFCTKCMCWRGELGNEPTPELYILHLTQIFAVLRRVLVDDGTLFVNIGNTFGGSGYNKLNTGLHNINTKQKQANFFTRKIPDTYCKKGLIGLAWMLAFALQKDDWILRSDNIWYKNNPMPESVKDRPVRAHEYVFMFAKNADYYYNHLDMLEDAVKGCNEKRTMRSVWQFPVQSRKEIHFATFPDRLAELCIKSGTNAFGRCTKCHKQCCQDIKTKEWYYNCNCDADTEPSIVLDLFIGSGTVAVMSNKLGRDWCGIELNPEYIQIAKERIKNGK